MRPKYRARLPNAKRTFEAGSVRHTSTKFFVVWKTSAGIFSRILIQKPQCIVLSSAAMVTAAETVQRGFAADAKKTSTTKDTKYHEGFCWGRFPSSYFVSFVVKRFRIHPYLTESRFGGIAQGDLYLRFALTLSKESGAATFHAQAYIPTQPAQAIEDTRISQAHEDPRRQEGYFPPSCQGAQAGLGETRFPRLVQWRGQASALPLLCQ